MRKRCNLLQMPSVTDILQITHTSYFITCVMKCVTYYLSCNVCNDMHKMYVTHDTDILFHHLPLTEDVRLQIFGSPDYPVFQSFLWSDGDFVYSRENLFEILGTPVKTCLNVKGTPVKTCWKFGSCDECQSHLLRPWCYEKIYVIAME